MRLLRINGTDIDIDGKTAIGITLQTYNIKEPGDRKISISNSFTIPRTAKNHKIIGFSGDSQFIQTTIYDSMICDYWVDNELLIKDVRSVTYKSINPIIEV